MAPAATQSLLPTHLPRELTVLLGRDDNLAALVSLVQRYRLVTLVGAGGMGKSLLAQHPLASRAAEHAQGLCWVELASVSDAAEQPARIAQALGVRAAEGEPVAGLCESLADGVVSPSPRLRACMVAVRPMVHLRQQQSLVLAERALALARELDGQALVHWPLYQALSLRSQAAAAVSFPAPAALREALAELIALESPRWPAQRLTRGLEAMRLARAALGRADRPAEQLRITQRTLEALQAEGQDTAPFMHNLIDAELECGHVEAGVALGERVLEQLAGTRDGYSRMLVTMNLVQGYLALDDTQRSRPLLQALWPAALQANEHALCSDSLALLGMLERRPRTAALLSGDAEAAYATRGLIVHRLEVAARERTRALARAALGDASFEHLLAQGRRLRDGQVTGLAFVTEDAG